MRIRRFIVPNSQQADAQLDAFRERPMHAPSMLVSVCVVVGSEKPSPCLMRSSVVNCSGPGKRKRARCIFRVYNMHRLKQSAAALAATLCLNNLRASANTVTDLCCHPQESDWAVNVVQQDDIAFHTRFVCGPDGAPQWFFAPETSINALSTDGRLGQPRAATPLPPLHPPPARRSPPIATHRRARSQIRRAHWNRQWFHPD